MTKSKIRMSTAAVITALVVALPMPSAPLFASKPKWAPVRAMTAPNTVVFQDPGEEVLRVEKQPQAAQILVQSDVNGEEYGDD